VSEQHKIYGDDPACSIVETDYTNSVHPGLTKRELFAAMAMHGLLACPATSGTPDEFARNAVAQADALIAALNKPVTSAQ
jgi:hypothetical protein